MIEVELKVKVNSSPQLEQLLSSLGAEFLTEEKQWDIYYNSPHRDFRATDEALRLRLVYPAGSMKGKSWLTYKGPKLDQVSKSREELTLQVDDWRNAQRLLQSLGFVEVGQVNKFRKTYRLGKFLISLDEVSKLGNFLEIESQATGDYSELLKEAFSLLEKLGFRREEIIRESYLELLKREEEG